MYCSPFNTLNFVLSLIFEIPVRKERLSCGFPSFPFLVVTKITPLAPSAPYIEVAEASLRTVMDSISSGFI